MITFSTDDAPLLRVTVKGHVSRDEIRKFYRSFQPSLDVHAPVGVLINLTDFEDISAGAVLEDIIHEIQLLDDLKKMPRIAVVTPLGFLRGVADWAGKPLRKVDMKGFAPEDLSAAEAFARDLPQRETRQTGPGVTFLDSGSPDVIAFEVNGYIDDDEAESFMAPFKARLAQPGPFSVLGKITRMGGFDPELLFDRALLGTKWQTAKQLQRYAIVTDYTWMRPMLAVMNSVTKAEFRFFTLSEEQAAWTWVKEDTRVV